MERSKLACTPDDITILKEKLQKLDIVDLCTRERERQYQMEVLQTDKSHSDTQSCTNRL